MFFLPVFPSAAPSLCLAFCLLAISLLWQTLAPTCCHLPPPSFEWQLEGIGGTQSGSSSNGDSRLAMATLGSLLLAFGWLPLARCPALFQLVFLGGASPSAGHSLAALAACGLRCLGFATFRREARPPSRASFVTFLQQFSVSWSLAVFWVGFYYSWNMQLKSDSDLN